MIPNGSTFGIWTIRVQRKRKNKDIVAAQKVYCFLLRIYSSVLANLNLANLYISTSYELPRHCDDWHRFEMWTDPSFPFSQSPVLKLHLSSVISWDHLDNVQVSWRWWDSRSMSFKTINIKTLARIGHIWVYKYDSRGPEQW